MLFTEIRSKFTDVCVVTLLSQPPLHDGCKLVVLDEGLVDHLDHDLAAEDALAGHQIVQFGPGLVPLGQLEAAGAHSVGVGCSGLLWPVEDGLGSGVIFGRLYRDQRLDNVTRRH